MEAEMESCGKNIIQRLEKMSGTAPEQGDVSIQVYIRQMVWNKAEDVKRTVRPTKWWQEVMWTKESDVAAEKRENE